MEGWRHERGHAGENALLRAAAAEFNTESAFHTLPAEAVLRVFDFLERDDLLRVGAVCRASLLLSEDDSLWPAQARRRIFFRKWTFESPALPRSGRGISKGALLDPHVVLVSEDRARLSLLSVLNDSLRQLALPTTGQYRVEDFAGHGSLLISVVSLNSGSAEETRLACMHDLERPDRPYLLDGHGRGNPRTYFDTLTCMSVNQDARRVAFGHRDGSVDCYTFALPASDAYERASGADGQPTGVVSLTEDVFLSRPRTRARLSVVHITALGAGDRHSAEDVQPPQSMLLCGYTNGKVEMVTNSSPRRCDEADTTPTQVQTKSFSLEEGSSVVWVRAEQNQILCACRSLVALASESLHILEREHSQDVDGWKQRCVLRPGKGTIVAAHSSRASDSVILAFATGIELWSKANKSVLVSVPLGADDCQVLSLQDICSASSEVKDDHWMLALTTRALHVVRLCHARVDKVKRATARPARRSVRDYFRRAWAPYGAWA